MEKTIFASKSPTSRDMLSIQLSAKRMLLQHSATVQLCMIVLMLLTACVSKQERAEMTERLEQLSACDRQDTVFTARHTTEAQQLTEWFDSYGSPREQVQAYYLLGRTYADCGEDPHALDCYQTAISRADTTAQDCDYHTLYHVYSQMGWVFHRQLLLSNEIEARRKAIHYALLDNDTLNPIHEKRLTAGVMIMLDKKDSAEVILKDVLRQYREYGFIQQELKSSMILMSLYAQNPAKLSELRRLMERFEAESDLFDQNHELQSRQRIYYRYKGRYFEMTGQLDSAGYYYRKVYHPAMGYSAQHSMYVGLLSVFQKLHRADSIAKYAQLYCAANDSSVAIKDQQLTAQLAASYNYRLYQQKARQKEKEAGQFKSTLLIVCVLFVILALLLCIAYNRQHNVRLRLEDRIRLLRGYAVNETLYNSSIAQHYRQLLNANPYQMPDAADWKELTATIDREVPSFRNTLSAGNLSDFEYDVCMLIKIQVPASDIARLKQCTPSYITQTRKNVYQKLFKKPGRADELDEYLMSL